MSDPAAKHTVRRKDTVRVLPRISHTTHGAFCRRISIGVVRTRVGSRYTMHASENCPAHSPSKEESAKASHQTENWHTNYSGDTPRTLLLTETEAAEWLRLSVKTLRAWRLRSKGPQFVRLGRAVRYLPSHLDEFLRTSTVVTTNAVNILSGGER